MPDTLPPPDEGKRREQETPSSHDPEADAPLEDKWDRQIERDAKAGRLDALAERARAHYRAGNVTDLGGNPVDE